MWSYNTGTAKKLAEAKKQKNYYLTMSGDYGGDHFLCCPAKFIKCDFKTLQNLLNDIDPWDKDGQELNFIEIKPGKSWLTTGEGGKNELWLSPGLNRKKKKIQAILDGKRKKIGIDFKEILKFIIIFPFVFIALKKYKNNNK